LSQAVVRALELAHPARSRLPVPAPRRHRLRDRVARRPPSALEVSMRALPTLTTLFGAALLVACGTGSDAAIASADTTMAAAPAAMSDDPDAITQGNGVPAGYLGQVDPPREGRQPADIAQAQYVVNGGRWEVTTGPAHIVYAAADTAAGNYTVTATVDQMEQPQHPEAFGL